MELRIEFTSPDRSFCIGNRDLAAIKSIASYGRVPARLDNTRQVEFNAQMHRRFDHG